MPIQPIQKERNRKFVLALAMGFALIQPSMPILAQTTTGDSNLPTKFYSQQPASTYGANFGGILTSCQNPGLQGGNTQAALNQALQTLFLDKKSMASMGSRGCAGRLPMITAVSPCPNVHLEAVSKECRDYQKNGSFSLTAVNDKLLEVKSSECAVECRDKKLDALRAEMKCLAKQSDTLTQQISSQLTKAYTDNVQRFQKDVTTLNQGVKARETQRTFVNEKLGGRSASGEVGWVALQGELSQGYNGMAAKIASVKELQNQIKQQRLALKEQANQVFAGYVSKCFRENKQPELRCIPKQQEGSVNVSVYDYVACIYDQRSRVQSNGYVNTKTTAGNAATAEASALKNLMDQIFATASTTSKVPTTPDEVAKSSEGAMGSLDPATVDAQFGARLAAFDRPGLKVRETVMRGLQVCNAWATPLVNQDRAAASKPLGAALYKIKELERNLGLQVDQPLDQYAQLYTKAMRELTGNNYPLNVKQCRAYAQGDLINKCDSNDSCREKLFGYQNSCLEELRTNMEGIYRGTTQNSNIKMVIPSRNSAMLINLECAGMDGCVRKMQTISKQIDDDIEKLGESKASYIQQANQSIEKFTSEVSTQLASQSQALNNRLKDLNLSLSEYGEGIAIKIENRRPEEFDKDQDGLIKAPKNILDVVGGRSNPPLLDISGNNFADSISGIGKASGTVAEEKKTIQTSLRELSSLPATCAKEGMQATLDRIVSYNGTLDANRCGTIARFCDPDAQGNSTKTIGEIGEVVDSILGRNPESVGIDSSVFSNLNSGLQCNGASNSTIADEIQTKETEITRLSDQLKVSPPPSFEQQTMINTQISVAQNALTALRTQLNEENQRLGQCSKVVSSIYSEARRVDTRLKNLIPADAIDGN